jgi:hypothetical protein
MFLDSQTEIFTLLTMASPQWLNLAKQQFNVASSQHLGLSMLIFALNGAENP